MAKYCKSCGEEMKGSFCEKCGYGKPQERAKAFDKYKSNRQIKEEKLKRSKKSVKKKASPASIAVLVIVALLVIVLILFGLNKAGIIGAGDKTEPIKAYFEAIAENDYDKYVSTMPDAIAKTYDEYLEAFSMSKEDFVKQSYSDYYMLLGDSFTVEVNCGEQTQLGGSEIEDAEKSYQQNFGEKVNFKDAYIVNTEVVFKGSETTETYYYDVYVARIGFSWYIVNIEDYYTSDELSK